MFPPTKTKTPSLLQLAAVAILFITIQTCSDPNCKSCPTNTNVCEACKTGYYLNATCSPCSSQVQDCSVCLYDGPSASVKCTKCANTFALNVSSATQCVNCLPSMPLCNKCAVDASNSSKLVCSECNALSIYDNSTK